MISKKLHAAINEQIRLELDSAHLYFGMSLYCEQQNYKGFAHWMSAQQQEENGHAMKLISYLLDRGAAPVVPALTAPPAEFGSPLQVFEKVLAHEKLVTASIEKLYRLAVEENDLKTQIFLQWYISEQVEEEATATGIVEKLKMIGDKSVGAIFYVDKELGKRA